MLFCVITIVMAIFYIKNLINQWPIILAVLLYLGTLFFSTVLNHVDLAFFLNYAVTVLFFVFFFELAVNVFKYDIFNAVWWVCFILTVINILSILIYPNGLYIRYDVVNSIEGMPYWFLGNRNLFIDFLFPMMALSLFMQYCHNTPKTKFYISLFLSILTVMLTGSATSILVILIISGYYFVLKNHRIKMFNPSYLSVIYTIISLTIIGAGSSSLFSYFIVNVLNKDITLSSRTIIWRNVIDHIRYSPWVGYGYRSATNFLSNSNVAHAHNMFLHATYSGGIIALFFLCAIFVLCIKRIRKCTNEKLYMLCTFIYFAYLWMEFSEPRIYFPFLFGLAVILWNAPLLERKPGNVEKTERS